MRKFFALPLLVCAAQSTFAAAPLRPFTVTDSIEFSTFAYPGLAYGQATARVIRSPDGKNLAAVTVKGDLATGQRIATLWVLDAADIRKALMGGKIVTPRALAIWGSASNTDPISQWRWRGDSGAMLFLGADDEGTRTLLSVDLKGGKPRALSEAHQDVTQYAEVGGHVVYLAGDPMPARKLYAAAGSDLPDIVEAFGQNAMPLLLPYQMQALLPELGPGQELWRSEPNEPAPVTDPETGKPIRLKDSSLVLSSDGRRVLTRHFIEQVPKAWERYRPLIEYPGIRFVADTPGNPVVDSIYRPQSYQLIDVATGKADTLLDTPIETLTQFEDVSGAWSPKGDVVAVTGAYPMPQSARVETLPCALGVVDVITHHLTCLKGAKPRSEEHFAPGDRPKLIDLSWSGDGATLLARYATTNAPQQQTLVRFARQAGAWTSTSSSAQAERDFGVDVREDLDEPPAIVATARDGVAVRLFDPNPQFAQIARASIRPFSWKNSDGAAWNGALVLPPDFQAGHPYPLVLQTHGLDKGKFLVDGPSATGFAARALAAHGIVVLQVDETTKGEGTPTESVLGAAGYHAAIEALTRQGLIDPHKVGILAWSHYGPWALQGLVDYPDDYAAASFAEAGINSYDEYLWNIDYMGASREKMFRAQVGAKPFGEGLKTWLQKSAGFRTDRICTPTFWQMNDPTSLVYNWGNYAVLRAQNKPVDLLYLRSGAHALVKPRERLVEQGMNVDWFDYWLNGRRDPSPAKAAQYRRWDALKDQPRCGDSDSPPAAHQ